MIYSIELKRLKQQAKRDSSMVKNHLAQIKTTHDAHARGIHRLAVLHQEIENLLRVMPEDII